MPPKRNTRAGRRQEDWAAEEGAIERPRVEDQVSVSGVAPAQFLLSPPGEFDLEADDWQLYQERLEEFFIVNRIDESKKVSLLISIIGRNGYRCMRDLCDPQLPKEKSFKELCATMSRQFVCRVSIFRERIKFYALKQAQAESIADWYRRVKKGAALCKFGAFQENALKDRFVCGLSNNSILGRLCELNPMDKSFLDVYELALHKEASDKGKAGGLEEVGKLAVPRKSDSSRPKEGPTCNVCGKTNHSFAKCKFKKYRCDKCGKQGHLAKVCRGSADKTNHLDDGSSSESSLSRLEVYEVDSGITVPPFMAQVTFEGKSLELEIDTGAGVTIMPSHVYRSMFRYLPLSKTDLKLRAYGGEVLTPLGVIQGKIVWRGKEAEGQLVVVPKGSTCLLGRDWLQLFGLRLKEFYVNTLREGKSTTDLDALLKEYKDLFREELGCYKFEKVNLRLKPDVKPKFYKPRPIPFAFRTMVDEELARLEKEGQISRIDHCPWGTPLVPVLKPDGSLRLCANYKITVNPCLEDENFPLPRIEEVWEALQGGVYYSKIDFVKAYNQLELDEEAKNILAWSTHKGLFKVNRLTFGPKIAVAVFQRTVQRLLQGVPGVINFLDDVIITGKTREEHLKHLREVFKRLLEAGFTLNLKKCSFFQKEVKYLGHIISSAGIKQDPEKVKALNDMPAPKNQTEVRAFAGLINYYGKFVPSLADIMSPIYGLLKKGTHFKWTQDCQAAFEKAKRKVAKGSMLICYDQKLPVKLYCDASKYGLGAVLVHVLPTGEEKPISCASRLLNKAEKNYSVIHKEALAIYWGISKFYQYLMGKRFTLVTDHRPLVALFGEKKGIPEMAAGRLQRWAFYLSGFDFDVQYVKSTSNPADGLSRLPNGTTPKESDSSEYVSWINKNFNIDLSKIRTETRRDRQLSAVSDFVRQGWWPQDCDEALKPYARRKNELSIEEGVVMWGYRVVIPKKLRTTFLGELHETHEGMSKMKSRARSYFWWPSLDEDIETYVNRCQICMAFRDEPPKTPLKKWPETSRPFERIHVDLCGPLKGKTFLVVTDTYSKWPEVYSLNSTSSESTLDKLKQVFARYGLPKTVVTDNGPQFRSAVFEEFCRQNNITALKSPPYHPSSNGAAENTVKTFKKGLSKCLKGNTSNESLCSNVSNYLFQYRTAVHATTGETPAKLMFGRELRTRLDVLKEKGRGEREKKEEEDNAGRPKSFDVGETVYMRSYVGGPEKKTWTKGKIVGVLGSRLYQVEEEETKIIHRRHADQIIRAAGEEPPSA